MPRRYLNSKSVLTYITGWMTTLLLQTMAISAGLIGRSRHRCWLSKGQFYHEKIISHRNHNDKLEQKNWLSTIWFTE